MVDKISVIVPVFKVEDYLDRSVRSIVSQTYSNLEIILVDDGSPDSCPLICDKWAQKDERIRVIHKENGGLSDARNAGLEIASGTYIGFVDSDDWIAPEMYEKLLSAIQKDASDIAACGVEMVWEDGAPSRIMTQATCCLLDKEEAQAELLSEKKLKHPVWYKLYRRDAIKDILFEKGKYHEDVFWSYQAIGRAEKVSIIDYIGYYYWQRSGSIMGAGYSMKRLDAMEACCMRYEYIKTAFPKLEKAALRSVRENCIYHGQMALKYLPKEEQNIVFRKLREVQKQYPITYSDYASVKISHQVWIALSKVNLKLVCKIKNGLGVGL